ncbi:MAG: hypothetical protein IPP77_13285 [Bacteroidetes bacterium]|nr:hypothetical protein [Bacteroidota bacterium]
MKGKLLHFVLVLLWSGSLFANDRRGDTIDIRSVRLNLNLTDFTNKFMYADAVIGIQSRMNAVGSIRLDLLKLTVDSIKVNEVQSTFTYNDSVILIPFQQALNMDDSASLHIYYHGKPLQVSVILR